MQNTLIKIGKQILEKRGKLDEIISVPKVDLYNNNGEMIKNYSLNIVFDLDQNTIQINKENLVVYNNKESPSELMNIDSELWGRRGNPLAICTEFKKIGILSRSMAGEFVSAVERGFPEFNKREFVEILKEIKKLETKKDDQSGKEKMLISKFLDKTFITNEIKLGRNEKLVLIYVSVKSKTHGFYEPERFNNIDGYLDFIEKRFLKEPEKSKEKLCYSTGNISTQITKKDFKGRNFITKIYQTTIKNFANNLDEKSFPKNYQIDSNTLKALDASAEYINKKLSVKIAGLSHNIVPQVLNNTEFELDYIESKIKPKTELLFNTQEISTYTEQIEDETDDSIYWLNFVAYFTDGNSYKIVNLIKDVSSFHLSKVICAFAETGEKFDQYLYGKNVEKKYRFNLKSIYFLACAAYGKYGVCSPFFITRLVLLLL